MDVDCLKVSRVSRSSRTSVCWIPVHSLIWLIYCLLCFPRDFLPRILRVIARFSNPCFLMVWPKKDAYLLAIAFIIHLLVPVRFKTSSFVTLSVHLILSILLKNHITSICTILHIYTYIHTHQRVFILLIYIPHWNKLNWIKIDNHFVALLNHTEQFSYRILIKIQIIVLTLNWLVTKYTESMIKSVINDHKEKSRLDSNFSNLK